MKIGNIDMRGSVNLKNPKGSITFSGSKNSTITNSRKPRDLSVQAGEDVNLLNPYNYSASYNMITAGHDVNLLNPLTLKLGQLNISAAQDANLSSPNIFSMTNGFEVTAGKNIYLMTASGLKTFDKSQIISFVDGKFYIKTLSDMKKYSIVDGDLVEDKPATDKTVTNTNS